MNEGNIKKELWDLWDEFKKKIETKGDYEVFYRMNIIPKTVEFILQTMDDNLKEKIENCEVFIVSVGMTLEQTLIEIATVRPKIVVFLATRNGSEENISEIRKLYKTLYKTDIVEDPDKNTIKVLIEKDTNLGDIYAKLQDKIIELNLQNYKNKMLISMTGGTKFMSAACSVFGHHLGIPVLYLSGDRDPELFSKYKLNYPIPVTQKLVEIENPYKVLYYFPLKEVVDYFKNKEFFIARQKIKGLHEKISNPDVEFVKYIVEGYASLMEENFSHSKKEFEEALKFFDEAYKIKMKNLKYVKISNETKKNVKMLLNFTEPLCNIHNSSKDVLRDETVMRNYAILRYSVVDLDVVKDVKQKMIYLYSGIEFMAQHLLAREYGVDASNVDEKSKEKLNDVKPWSEVKKLLNKIICEGRIERDNYSDKMGMIEVCAFLFDDESLLKGIYSISQKRNNVVHRINSEMIKDEDIKKAKNIYKTVFEKVFGENLTKEKMPKVKIELK